MKKLPKYLYHYTSLPQMEFIVEDGEIHTSPSNLKLDDGPIRYEPTIRKGEVIGTHVANKYANYHPVVWLTANDAPAANETGLHEAKLMARLVIPTKGVEYRFLSWPEFIDKYHAARDIIAALKKSNGSDWRNWYVSEAPLPMSFVERIEVRTEDGTYVPYETPRED